MNKKITSALVAVLLAVPATAQANLKNRTVGSAPTLAVIDTAINSNDPIFNGKVVHEVCILAVSVNNCANGKNYMEGPGAALVPNNVLYSNKYLPGLGFDHGTVITNSAITSNSNMNIVFIRIVEYKADGTRGITGTDVVINAINWIINNKDKFNIKAVNMSQGHSRLLSGPNYCPKVPELELSINNLSSQGLPIFFPTGNGFNPSKIDFPACIPSAIAVGATEVSDRGLPTEKSVVASFSNNDNSLTDFFDNGFIDMNLNGKQSRLKGTSISSARSAAGWVMLSSLKPNLKYNEIYDLLVKTSKSANNSRVKTSRVINIQGAING